MIGIEKEYAAALFMLAAEQDRIQEYGDALRMASELAGDEYLDFLSSPAVPLNERLGAIAQSLGSLPEHVVSCIQLMCENGAVRLLSACADEYARLTRVRFNTTEAKVTSAAPLSDEQKAVLCERLQQLIGKPVEARYLVDTSLIGGLVVEVEGKTYDGSLKHRLHDVKDVMIR